MRIFFLCQRVPFPPDRGDKITTHHELAHLHRNHEVHVFCLADGEEDLANVEGARRHATSVTAVLATPRGTRLRALRGLLTGEPLSVVGYRFAELQAAVDRAVRELRPDLVWVFSANMAQYAMHHPVPRVVQFADLDSLKWSQYAASAQGLMRWVYAREHRTLLAHERELARASARSVVCTENERRDFREQIPGVTVDILANGVDLDYFRPSGCEKVRGRLVFTGVMDYLPNVDAVVWFAQEVLPLIRRDVPHASFVVCGSRPSAQVQALAELPGVTVTGRVPDVRPYVESADVFVGSLRIARGVQNKVLEALALRVPCVTTRKVLAGTEVTEAHGILAADDAAEFAAHVVRLLQDDSLREEQARLGREAVERLYDWQAQFAVLDRVIARALQAPQVPR
jgi:sugar transferase (PEP-CTERM/EpsH1 system associated)